MYSPHPPVLSGRRPSEKSCQHLREPQGAVELVEIQIFHQTPFRSYAVRDEKSVLPFNPVVSDGLCLKILCEGD